MAKGMADKALEVFEETDDLAEGLEKIIEYGDYVLSQTPELLPVLKQAGVVDSGGQGLMEVVKGAYEGLLGKEVDLTIQPASPARTAIPGEKIDTADIKFGYCTEFIVMLEKPYDQETEKDFKKYLSSIGDSIVCVHDEDIVKVHVHTNDPGLAIQKGLSYGSLTSMKIDNMREEHHEKLIKDAQNVAKAQAEADARMEEAADEPNKPAGICFCFRGRRIE